jgi:hypothetical protein
VFLAAKETGNLHYQYDFERDGTLDWTLESNRVRLIVSPVDGGRALALVDKSTSDNFITLGGALHDFIVPSGTAPQQTWASGDFSFNDSYHPEWIEGELDTRLRLTYQDHENSPAGIHVEKTLRFAAPETVEAAYRISMVAPPSPVAAGGSELAKSFISALSVPALAPIEGSTSFCWQNASTPAPVTATATSAAKPPHCEDFIPSGMPIAIPDGVARIEIHYLGRQPLIVEWSSGRAVILPKEFSAEVNFAVPIPASSEPPGEFTLRYTVGSGP